MTPLSPANVVALVHQMQGLGSELPEVEAKDGRRGLPQRVIESLSAFGNRRGGGTIVFGIDDSTYRPVGGLNISKLQADLAVLPGQRLSHPLRLEPLVCEVDGVTVLAISVPECPLVHKPIYDRRDGLFGGSWLRVGNTNHRLTEAEVRAILRASDRDDTDVTPVDEARIADLSPGLIAEYKSTLAERRPGSRLTQLDDPEMLLAIRAATYVGDRLAPTVAGVLFFAEEPQHWLPGTFISFLQFPGTDVALATGNDQIYLDNVRINGPLPTALDAARRTVLSRIRKRALLQGLTRREIPEYPDWAYREALVNAVAHRDYGITGAHIQVRLFSDRIEVQSPGGLFGTVSEANIETEQSTRNHAVVGMLEHLGLVEQRGIGINLMVQSMLEAGLERPVFRDSLTSFLVALKNHTMMDDEAYRWLSNLSGFPITDPQRMALVYTWRTGKIANRDYQRVASVSSVAATHGLRRLVNIGLLTQHGTRGPAFYTLNRLALNEPGRRALSAVEIQILEHVANHGPITNSQAREIVGIDDVSAMRQVLRRMVRGGYLVQRGSSKRHTYYEVGGLRRRTPNSSRRTPTKAGR